MLVAKSPSSIARSWCAFVTSWGSVPSWVSASSSNPISSSVKARARRWRSRSSGVRPYIGVLRLTVID